MIIRPYRKGDFAAIMNLWTATGLGRPERGDDETTVERSIEIGGEMLVMCDESDSDRIIGTSWTTFDGRRLHLHHFGIDPLHQGKGLAKDLLRKALKFVKEKRCQVKLEVHRSNRAAINLYKGAGFEYLGDYDIYIIRDIQNIEV
ncbi:MAG: GNAT family N-acetyltransferase [Bacteroidales bacterium]|nr:GNAT family N-acetyltransferase [Bacteroidales bacterium]